MSANRRSLSLLVQIGSTDGYAAGHMMTTRLRDGDRVRIRQPLDKIWPGIWVVFDANQYGNDDFRLRKLGEESRTLEACRHEVSLCKDNEAVRGLAGQERVVKKNRRLINKILKEIGNERKNQK